MTVTLNGERKDMSPDATVRDLLCALDFERGAVAVAVNGVFVPRSQHATHVLRDGDALELLAPMQGG